MRRALLLACMAVAAAACRTAPAEAEPSTAAPAGDVEVVAVWQDAEAAAFEEVLGRFEQLSGYDVSYTSTAGQDLGSVLDDRLAADDPPDVAVLPQPGLLERYATGGDIVPIDSLVGDVVATNWAPIWQRLGTVDGELYGVWFKAAGKSLFWYSIGAFESAGVVPPSDLEGLRGIADTLAAAGTPPFSLTGAPQDAWTLTDWFENLYLLLAGPERYDALAAHRIPWTDDTVAATLQTMAELLAPEHTVWAGGADTTFPESVAAVFSAEPEAAMVMEGDFVPGVVAGSADWELGVDVDVFPFPGRTPSDRFVVGGGDAAVLMRSSPAGEALIGYLATPEAAEVWARLGGFVSPNEAVDLTAYTDPTAQRIARTVLEAGDGFRFDLSDLQPVELGGTTDGGMWAELTRFVADPSDIEGTMARLEAAATAAWADD